MKNTNTSPLSISATAKAGDVYDRNGIEVHIRVKGQAGWRCMSRNAKTIEEARQQIKDNGISNDTLREFIGGFTDRCEYRIVRVTARVEVIE